MQKGAIVRCPGRLDQILWRQCSATGWCMRRSLMMGLLADSEAEEAVVIGAPVSDDLGVGR